MNNPKLLIQWGRSMESDTMSVATPLSEIYLLMSSIFSANFCFQLVAFSSLYKIVQFHTSLRSIVAVAENQTKPVWWTLSDNNVDMLFKIQIFSSSQLDIQQGSIQILRNLILKGRENTESLNWVSNESLTFYQKVKGLGNYCVRSYCWGFTGFQMGLHIYS